MLLSFCRRITATVIRASICLTSLALMHCAPANSAAADTELSNAALPTTVQSASGRTATQARYIRQIIGATGATTDPAKVYELHNLIHRSADHETADALVRVPNDLDPTRSIKLVIYNHGFGTNVKSIYSDSRLGDQMRAADKNTVLVLPEWQAQADSRKGFQGRFSEAGMFRDMLKEILSLTPELTAKKLGDVSEIYIAAHSAGYGPTMTEIYKNGLDGKIRSIALLDALYTDDGFSNWLMSNLNALRQGKKRFYNVFFDSTRDHSKEQAALIQKLWPADKGREAGLLLDYSDSDRVLQAGDLRGKSAVFIYSAKSVDGLDQHFAIPRLYFGTLLEASQQFKKQPER